MTQKDDLGRAGEQQAADYLSDSGYAIVDRNWRHAQGEIDIVAVREDALVIVEVKTRRTERFGHPFEAIDERKRRRLWRLAYAWAEAHPETSRGRRLRIDAIGIIAEEPRTLEHLEDLL